MALTDAQKESRRTYRLKQQEKNRQLKAIREQAKHHQKIQNEAIQAKYDLKAIETEFKGKTEAEKLRLTYTELVRRLAIESHRNFITEVDWEDEVSIILRKKQMDNLKGMLTVTKMMNDLIIQLETTGDRSKVLSAEEQKDAENVISMAQKLLDRKIK